jgi:hypothetical protein
VRVDAGLEEFGNHPMRSGRHVRVSKATRVGQQGNVKGLSDGWGDFVSTLFENKEDEFSGGSSQDSGMQPPLAKDRMVRATILRSRSNDMFRT